MGQRVIQAGGSEIERKTTAVMSKKAPISRTVGSYSKVKSRSWSNSVQMESRWKLEMCANIAQAANDNSQTEIPEIATWCL
jgi:hypothetical protein